MSDVDEDRELRQQALSAAVLVQTTIARTGRCLCGRRPTLRDRVRGQVLILLDHARSPRVRALSRHL